MHDNEAAKKIMRYYKEKLIGLIVMLILTPKSWLAGLRSLFKPDILLIEKPYQGEKILLIALFEKGELRKDIKRLLTIAKQLNLYVMGVNTQQLNNEEIGIFDCYIERYNFGQDFGSYQQGIRYLMNKKYYLKCPRLLLLNDSVYYESTRCKKFINDLISSDKEVLGATENLHSHHIGAFCISIKDVVLKHKSFLKFWKNYKKSNIRKVVIQTGEITLSKYLKYAVTSQQSFCTLYGPILVAEKLKDPECINAGLKYAIKGTNELKPVIPSLKSITEKLINENVLSQRNFLGHIDKLLVNNTEQEYSYIKNLESANMALQKIVGANCMEELKALCCAELIAGALHSSQIHINNPFLFYLGLPIVKLDGYYRGMFSIRDVLAITDQMQPEEAQELQRLLLRRGNGFNVLPRFQKMMFKRGFI